MISCIQEIVDFILKGPWRIPDASKDAARQSVAYVSANDTLNLAIMIVSPFEGCSILRTLKACQCVRHSFA
jgi:hypothetical protein